jgi:hypothetical protein
MLSQASLFLALLVASVREAVEANWGLQNKLSDAIWAGGGKGRINSRMVASGC